MDDADDHVFGFCLFNDWSARDLQAWEYQPLGPFLAKNFASTVSPWIVTNEALAPYRLAWTRDENDPQPLDYLESSKNRELGALDIQMDVAVETEKMRSEEKRRTAYHSQALNTRTGPWHKWSPTTPLTAVTSSQAICWVQALSLVLSTKRRAHC